MSQRMYIAHSASETVDGAQRCQSCQLELPSPGKWQPGERVCIGPGLMPYGVPQSQDLDDDEIPCAGVVDVGERSDA